MHGDLANYLGIYPVQQVPTATPTQTITMTSGIASAEAFGNLVIRLEGVLEVIYLAVTRRLQGLRGR